MSTPTIGNLPAADVSVQFPSGAVKNVNMIYLLALTQHAECMGKFGHGLAPNAPNLSDIREMFEMPDRARTWKIMAHCLRRFHTDLRNAGF